MDIRTKTQTLFNGILQDKRMWAIKVKLYTTIIAITAFVITYYLTTGAPIIGFFSGVGAVVVASVSAFAGLDRRYKIYLSSNLLSSIIQFLILWGGVHFVQTHITNF